MAGLGFLLGNNRLQPPNFLIRNIEQPHEGAVTRGVERRVLSPVKLHLFAGLVGLGFPIQRRKHRADFFGEVGADFPDQRLGLMEQLAGVDRAGEEQEVQTPVDILGTVTVRDAGFRPSTQFGNGSQVFQAIPGQLPTGEDAEVAGLAPLEKLKRFAPLFSGFSFFADCVPVYGKNTFLGLTH